GLNGDAVTAILRRSGTARDESAAGVQGKTGRQGAGDAETAGGGVGRGIDRDLIEGSRADDCRGRGQGFHELGLGIEYVGGGIEELEVGVEGMERAEAVGGHGTGVETLITGGERLDDKTLGRGESAAAVASPGIAEVGPRSTHARAEGTADG